MALPGVVAGQSLPSVEGYPQTASLTPAEGWPHSVGIGGRLASESVATFRRNHRPLCAGIRKEVAADLPRFLEGIYNERRLHSALGYRSPAEFERQHAQEGVKAPA